MQEEIVSNKLTLAEVKDCAYARMCRRGTAVTFALFAVFLVEVAAIYLLLRYINPEKAHIAYFMPLMFVPALIASVAYNGTNLHKFYANYENWELVTCKISCSLVVNSAKSFAGSATMSAVDITFTTADGNIRHFGVEKVKKAALIATIRLERYHGEAQFLFDAKNRLLYPFSQLPPKSKKA